MLSDKFRNSVDAMIVKRAAVLLVLMLFGHASAVAQEASAPQPDKGMLAMGINDARERNAIEMRNYAWSARTVVKYDGQVRSSKEELVKFAPDGQMQRIVVSDTASEAKQPRGIRGRIAANRIKSMKEWGAELGQMLKQYATMSPGTILDFLDQATITPTGNMVTLEGQNVVQPNDSIVMLVDAASKELKTIDVQTHMDGDTVKVHIVSETTDDGLRYTARQTVSVPAQKVELEVENYDFRRE